MKINRHKSKAPANNFVAKNTTQRGGFHGKTHKAERRGINTNLLEEAREEYEDDKESGQ